MLLYFIVAVLLIVSGTYAAIKALNVSSLWIIVAICLPIAALMGLLLSRLAIEPLQSHFETLERFSAQTLHEINLPATTIMTNAKMLRQQCTDPKSIQRLDRIESSCGMLMERYNELDYLIKRQMQREVIEPFDLADVIQERLDVLSDLYRPHLLMSDLEPVSLELDKMGFVKVLDNLIDNAAKYSPSPSEITVTLKNAILRVEDRGCGMDQVELLKVFDRYYQADESMPGFGIGLDLIKRYCDRHRIALRIESVPEQGTAVILDFSGVR